MEVSEIEEAIQFSDDTGMWYCDVCGGATDDREDMIEDTFFHAPECRIGKLIEEEGNYG